MTLSLSPNQTENLQEHDLCNASFEAYMKACVHHRRADEILRLKLKESALDEMKAALLEAGASLAVWEKPQPNRRTPLTESAANLFNELIRSTLTELSKLTNLIEGQTPNREIQKTTLDMTAGILHHVEDLQWEIKKILFFSAKPKIFRQMTWLRRSVGLLLVLLITIAFGWSYDYHQPVELLATQIQIYYTTGSATDFNQEQVQTVPMMADGNLQTIAVEFNTAEAITQLRLDFPEIKGIQIVVDDLEMKLNEGHTQHLNHWKKWQLNGDLKQLESASDMAMQMVVTGADPFMVLPFPTAESVKSLKIQMKLRKSLDFWSWIKQ